MELKKGVVYIGIPTVIAVMVWYMFGADPGQLVCRLDLPSGKSFCHPRCPSGYFSLYWMSECHPWLRCVDIERDLKIKLLLGRGAVKVVYLAQWQKFEVAYNSLNNPSYKEDFRHGLRMLANFQPSVHVTQLLGYCGNVYITEYHKHGSAANFQSLIKTDKFKEYNNLKTRFGMCLKYARIIDFLHNSKLGTRVMCDSNDLEKTLDQYLLTSDLDLIVNDLDALPEVNHKLKQTIKCGPRQIFGDFVAPEQLWPHEDWEFSDSEMPGYDEKTDIWKIPAVCNYFLGSVSGADNLQFHLFKIHKACKNLDPERRPNSSSVLQEYERIWTELVIGLS